MRLSTLSIAIVALMAPIASADALPPVRAGILQCQGGQNVGFVVGSVTSLECVFQSQGRRPEPYIATVRRFGLDVGITQQTQFSWAVSSPDGRLGRGGLAGNYGGVGANASVGVGFGGNFLVGGPANAYALQPISVQGQTGLNVAAGVAGIELQPLAMGVRMGATTVVAVEATTNSRGEARFGGPLFCGRMCQRCDLALAKSGKAVTVMP